MATAAAATALAALQALPVCPTTPSWTAAKAAAGAQGACEAQARDSPASVATAAPADLPRLPSDASVHPRLAPAAAGVKRSHASAFEPFPMGGPARHVLPRRDACDSPAASSERSGSASVRAEAAAAPAPAHLACANSAASSPPQGSTHEQLLAAAFRLLPRLEPPAAALLLAQMRALIQRGRATVLAARGMAAVQPPAPPVLPVTGSLAMCPTRRRALNRALFGHGIAFIQAGLPRDDVAALAAARAFLARF